LLPNKRQRYSSCVTKFIIVVGSESNLKKATGRTVIPYLYNYSTSYSIRRIFSLTKVSQNYPGFQHRVMNFTIVFFFFYFDGIYPVVFDKSVVNVLIYVYVFVEDSNFI
jgi:hypothetical protein